MAYFDSPKNKVLWELELKELRKQRADFAAGKLVDIEELQKSRLAGTEHRKPVALEQLEKEESMAARAHRERGMAKDGPAKSRAPAMKAKSLKGR